MMRTAIRNRMALVTTMALGAAIAFGCGGNASSSAGKEAVGGALTRDTAAGGANSNATSNQGGSSPSSRTAAATSSSASGGTSAISTGTSTVSGGTVAASSNVSGNLGGKDGSNGGIAGTVGGASTTGGRATTAPVGGRAASSAGTLATTGGGHATLGSSTNAIGGSATNSGGVAASAGGILGGGASSRTSVTAGAGGAAASGNAATAGAPSGTPTAGALDLSIGIVGGDPPPPWLTFSFSGTPAVAIVSGIAAASTSETNPAVPAGSVAPALIQFNPAGEGLADWTGKTKATLTFQITSSSNTSSASYQAFILSGEHYGEWYSYGDAAVAGSAETVLEMPLVSGLINLRLNTVGAIGIQVYDLTVGEQITITVKSIVVS